ncbi:MAG: IS200/IS605 family transposase [Verrucomicrobiales bacterium]
MPNTYTCLPVHFIFSTKDRLNLIARDLESDLWAFLGGIAKENGMKPIKIGGVENHIHALVGLPPTLSCANAMKFLKGGSSRWINSEKRVGQLRFSWQDGYAAFAVSRSALEEVVKYITNQRSHHQKVSFEDEYRRFLDRHGIAFDERYLF